jgi:hypothetical protein
MKPQIRATTLALGLCALHMSTALAGSPVTAITTDFIGGTISNTANLTSVTSHGGFTVSDLIAPSEIFYSGVAPLTYRGAAGSGIPTIPASLLGLDISTGVSSSDSSPQLLNIIFPPAGVSRIFVFNVSSGTDVESGMTIQAIVGGNAGSPVLGASAFALPSIWGDSGRDLNATFPAISLGFTQNIVGYSIDVSDLGVGSLLGVQISAPTGSDPAAVVGSAIPEPAAAVLLATSGAACVFFRRRGRRLSIFSK